MGAPPGPRAPRLAQTLQFLHSPVGFMRKQRERYGDVFTVRFLGAPPLVYLTDPELVGELFRADEQEGFAGEARRPYFEPLVGSSSLLVLDGERWLEQRKLIGPPLHGNSIAALRERIAAVAAERIEHWPTGVPLQLRPRMQEITLEVILRVVFGLDEGAGRDRLRELLPRLLDRGQWLVWMPARVRDPLLRLLERRPRLRRVVPLASTLDVRDEVDRLLYEQIARRRADPDLTERDDILSLLLRARDSEGEAMGDRELRDELITLLEAGHETTATGLSWAFERLARNPGATASLREELGNGGGRDYLEATVKETLRSRPVVIDVIRLLARPLEVGGYRIPAGWYAGPATALIHDLPEQHPDPERFRPERFLSADPPYHAWLPFGGGKRRCVGSHLAQLEMATVIEQVLARFEVSAPDPEPESARVQHVTLVPARRATVVLSGLREGVSRATTRHA